MRDEVWAAETLLAYRRDPVLMVRKEFGAEPDEWQAEALREFAKPGVKRISMQACVGPGKTAVEAWMGWNFLACYGDDGKHPKGAAVAVTRENLDDNLWPEMSVWQQRSPFLMRAFRWTAGSIYAIDHPETWFLSARGWPKTANVEEQGRTLSGLHAPYVLVLLDESAEIPLAVLRAGEQAMSNCEWGCIAQAGNPTNQDGMLYAASTTLRDQWHVIPITGDPEDPKRSPRVDIEWARQQIESAAMGREDPWVMAHILGQFPPQAFNALLSIEDVERAMGRSYREDEVTYAPRVIGVDVAREGADKSVIFRRQGNVVYPPVSLPSTVLGPEGAGRVSQIWEEWDADACFIDGTGGFGGSWHDQLVLLGRSPISVHFASNAMDARYKNRRTEMWWKMCEWVRERGSLPKEAQALYGELTKARYGFHRDQIKLAEKDQMKVLLGRSPDMADALGLTFAQEVGPRVPRGDHSFAAQALRASGSGRAKTGREDLRRR